MNVFFYDVSARGHPKRFTRPKNDPPGGISRYYRFHGFSRTTTGGDIALYRARCLKMRSEITPMGVYQKVQEQEIAPGVYYAFVISPEGKMFEKITEGPYYV